MAALDGDGTFDRLHIAESSQAGEGARGGAILMAEDQVSYDPGAVTSDLPEDFSVGREHCTGSLAVRWNKSSAPHNYHTNNHHAIM